MDYVGIVGAVSVNSSSTITGEKILDQCKEAALKTSFGYNPDAPTLINQQEQLHTHLWQNSYQ